jgi:ATP-dependent RNA circularization protein (DNA/RNA ligase family)
VAHRLAEVIPREMAVQGELCGPGIQKNRLGLPSVAWFVFDAYDARAGRYLDHRELAAFCAERGLKTVPCEAIVEGVEATAFDHTLAHWLTRTAGRYEGTKNRKEGIVVRPLVARPSETLGARLSFKVIDNDFLLKDDE